VENRDELKLQGFLNEEIGGALLTKSISWFCEILDSHSGIIAGSRLLV
jgi:hypothetical protein